MKAGAKGKSRQPLLGDLLAELLGQYKEPRLARELRDELLEEYPDGNPTPQVVRNTLVHRASPRPATPTDTHPHVCRRRWSATRDK